MPDNNLKDKILTAEELSTLFSVPTRTIVRLAKEGKIPAMKIGGKWRFEKETIENWMKQVSSQRARKKILIIEDDPGDRRLLRNILEKVNAVVSEASTIEGGINLLDSENFDVIMLDLIFPEEQKQGVDLLLHLEKKGVTIPVVIVTGYPHTSHLKDALKYGWFIVVSKPIVEEQLTEAVEAIFKKAL